MDGRNTDALSVWEIMRIGLLSDTHGWLDVKIEEFFKDCDEVWHLSLIHISEPTRQYS